LNPLDSKANFMYGGCPILSQRSRLGLAPFAALGQKTFFAFVAFIALLAFNEP
jgi:hypothetical protein